MSSRLVNHLSSNPESRLRRAIDFACANGLLSLGTEGQLNHCPFTISPCPIDRSTLQLLSELTPLFNQLAYRVARNLDFLTDVLAETANVDDFTRLLLQMAKLRSPRQSWRLMISRNDFFCQQLQVDSSIQPRQIEHNIIAAAYAGLAGRVCSFHRAWMSVEPLIGQLVENEPLPIIANGFAAAVSHYDYPDSVVLMIVQQEVSNLFDQRNLEIALVLKGVKVLRASFEEVAIRGRIHEGHLLFDDRIVAVTYLRAGWGPEDYHSMSAIEGRQLIEMSSTITVPDVAMQLYGTKRVQQALTNPKVLRQFCNHWDAQRLEETFVQMYDLDTTISKDSQAWEMAIQDPRGFVLKPQREGGGNNLYEKDLVEMLTQLSPMERKRYVLMERIYPPTHQTSCIVENVIRNAIVVSEIGRFGVFLAQGDEIAINEDAGYLVRSKDYRSVEGGVAIGVGYLDSLMIVEEQSLHPYPAIPEKGGQTLILS